MMPTVRRGFADIQGGQVHFRRIDGPAGGHAPPLVMFHASPGSSKMLIPLMQRFAATRPVLALDTLGNGDSDAPDGDAPDIAYFANAHLQALDALRIEKFDVYGSHTGGCIACEIAIRAPARVGKLILDGMSLYAEDEQQDMLRNYAPALTPSADGAHLFWIWHFIRDAFLFWPWYKRDAAHVRDVGLPSADALHDKFVEVAKAARTYHLSYRAAIGYDKSARLPLVAVPTLLSCARTDMLLRYFETVAALMPAAQRAITPGLTGEAAAADTIAIMQTFLDSKP